MMIGSRLFAIALNMKCGGEGGVGGWGRGGGGGGSGGGSGSGGGGGDGIGGGGGGGGSFDATAERCRHVATASFVVAGCALGGVWSPELGLGWMGRIVLFCIFEVSVGSYYPSFGTLKALHIPDSLRGVMSNLFR